MSYFWTEFETRLEWFKLKKLQISKPKRWRKMNFVFFWKFAYANEGIFILFVIVVYWGKLRWSPYLFHLFNFNTFCVSMTTKKHLTMWNTIFSCHISRNWDWIERISDLKVIYIGTKEQKFEFKMLEQLRILRLRRAFARGTSYLGCRSICMWNSIHRISLRQSHGH